MLAPSLGRRRPGGCRWRRGDWESRARADPGYRRGRSQSLQPGASRGVVHVPEQAGAHACVIVDVQGGQSLIRRVPEWCGDLVHQVESFEDLFIPRAVHDEPVRLWIVDAVAEGDVEAPGDFVDKVVHVVFKAAIVVAGEDNAPFVVEEDPTSEVNGFDANEVSTIEDMAGQEIRAVQHDTGRKASEWPGFEQARRGERVLDTVVFLRGQRLDARVVGFHVSGAAVRFMLTEQLQEERNPDQDERRQQGGRADNEQEVDLVCWRWWGRLAGPRE